MKRIRFSQNWNGKLNCDYFTTVRPASYDYKKDEIREIQNPTGKNFRVKILKKEEKTIEELTEKECFIDAALSKKEFVELMESFYKNKKFWKGKKTKVVALLLEKR